MPRGALLLLSVILPLLVFLGDARHQYQIPQDGPMIVFLTPGL